MNWLIRILGIFLILLGAIIVAIFGIAYMINRRPVIEEPLKQAGEVSQARYHTELPPKTFYINGDEWQLTAMRRLPEDAPHERGSTLLAETYCENRVILYDPDQNALELRNTIWHELFHAGACHEGDSDPEHWNSEEPHKKGDGYYRIGEYLSTLMRNNPELAHWLAK